MQNIQIYSTNSDLKAVFVERFNRTLLDLIKESLYNVGKACLLNNINNALDKYNNRVHGTAKMTPFDMVSKNNTAIPNLIPNNNKLLKLSKFPKFPRFQVGDFKRVPDKRNLYSKGYTTNWKREHFKIHNINTTTPVTYTLEDENKEIIQGDYYEQELLRPAFSFKSSNNFHKFE